MARDTAANATSQVFHDRKQRADKLANQWIYAWRDLLVGKPSNFEQFCKPQVVRDIMDACRSFRGTEDRYRVNTTTFERRGTGLGDPGSPVVVTCTMPFDGERFDGERRRLAPHARDPQPVQAVMKWETDPSITWIERILGAEMVTPRRGQALHR
ncbi:MAG: hypothetical protein ACYCZN_01945 [Candidatus Dormibacteria bacterium]